MSASQRDVYKNALFRMFSILYSFFMTNVSQLCLSHVSRNQKKKKNSRGKKKKKTQTSMTSPTSELRPCFHMKIMYCCNTMRFESHLIPHTSNSALLLSGSFCYSNMSLAPLLERKKKVEPSDSFKPAAVHGYRKESELLTVQLKPPLTPTNDTKQLFVLMGISFSKYTDTKSLCSGDRFHNCISW